MSDLVDREQLAANVQAVRRRITDALARSDRRGQAVELVAVTKTLPVAVIAAARDVGLTDFGENRVQEAKTKVAALPASRWHLVGHLQTNKVNQAAALFTVFQAVDSIRVAEKLSAALQKRGKTAVALAQVNTSGEPSKFGLAAAAVEEFFAGVQELPALRWAGLMTIGPFVDDEPVVRRAFAALRETRDRVQAVFPRLDLAELSMGMSDDFEIAIEEGATIVRLGRVLFGERQ